MSDKLTPLQVCEALIGSLPEIELMAGYQPKAGYTWRRAAQGRNAGDMPASVNRMVLRHARRKGIPLTAEHLIFGASRAEIEKLAEDMAATKLAAE